MKPITVRMKVRDVQKGTRGCLVSLTNVDGPSGTADIHVSVDLADYLPAVGEECTLTISQP